MKNCSRKFPYSTLLVSLLFLCLPAAPARAQSESVLAQRIRKVTSRPEFAHANFGIEFYSLDSGKVIYALNADKLFVPASTTKTLTEGTLLAKLGADYRFHNSRATSSSSPAAIPIFPIASSPTALSLLSTTTTLITVRRFRAIHLQSSRNSFRRSSPRAFAKSKVTSTWTRA